MSDINPNVRTSPWGQTAGRASVDVDAGLRAYMLHVYNYMVIGLAVTGLAALGIYMLSVTGDASAAAKVLRNGVEVPARIAGNMYLTSIGHTIFVSPVKWVIMLAPLAMVFGLSYGIMKVRPATAQVLFLVFAALMGLSLGSIFMVYTDASIAKVFFITAATFGAMSLWGYTTKRDLTGMGSFLFMGLIGLVIAMLVNIFLQSSMLEFAISAVGVLIFVGLTAYDTQKIKESYSASHGAEVLAKGAIMGALSLYLDFINLFVMLLRLFGNRE